MTNPRPYPLDRPCPRADCGAKVGDACGPEDYYAFMPHKERWDAPLPPQEKFHAH